jgi:hypothetical protein
LKTGGVNSGRMKHDEAGLCFTKCPVNRGERNIHHAPADKSSRVYSLNDSVSLRKW